MSGQLRRALVASLALAGGAAVAAPTAAALTARVDGDRVAFTAIGAERNRIEINFVSGSEIRIRETDASGPRLFGLGSGCDRVGGITGDPRLLVCRAPSLVSVKGDLGALDDRLTVIGLPNPVDVTGGPGLDVLSGGEGDDSLRSGSNLGETSTETLAGNGGDDTLRNDGSVASVGVRAFGGPGDDDLIGGPGDDFLRGDDGSDGLRGNGGDDDLDPGRGADSATGGDGADRLQTFSDGERDLVVCDDLPVVSDGSADSAVVDLQDIVRYTITCGSIRIAPVAVHPTVRLLAGSVRVGAGVRVDLACPAALAAPCAGTLRAAAVRGRRGQVLIGLGRTDYRVAPGRGRTVRIALDDRGRRVLGTAPLLRLTSREPGNAIGPKTATITVPTPG